MIELRIRLWLSGTALFAELAAWANKMSKRCAVRAQRRLDDWKRTIGGRPE